MYVFLEKHVDVPIERRTYFSHSFLTPLKDNHAFHLLLLYVKLSLYKSDPRSWFIRPIFITLQFR